MKALCEVSQFPSHTLEADHERNRSCPVSSRPNSHWHVRWQPEGHASNGIGCSGHPRNPPEIATFFGKEGGAIAHGHPIGASGAVLTTRLLHSLQRDGLKKGIVTLCIGGGQGIALALEVL